MKFLTKINFAPTFNENVTIIGFQVSPFKEIRLKGKLVDTVQCSEEEAQLYTLHAVTSEPPYQWIADLPSREHADQFALLLQSIYRSAITHPPAETYSEFVHPEIAAGLQTLSDQQSYNYNIKCTSEEPQNWELYIWEADADQTYNYLTQEDAENDIRMAEKYFNLELIKTSEY